MRRIFALTLILCLVTGCQSATERLPQAGQRWSSVDVRALRQMDAAAPNQDWIAAYARLTSTDLEIRLDRLNGSSAPENLLLALDFDQFQAASGPAPFSQWLPAPPDLLVLLPARGPSQVLGRAAWPGLRARFMTDDLQDSLVVRLSRRALPAQPLAASLLVLRYNPLPTADSLLPDRGDQRAAQPLESFGPLRLDAPPAPRAPLLLTFWDTLPAITPAQALRRWDGAHTGPFGQRHGLAILLEAAQQHAIPLAALDLARPERLAALQALDGLERVRALERAGLLILPAAAYGDPGAARQALAAGRQSADGYRLDLGRLVYGALPASGETLAAIGKNAQGAAAFFSYTQDDHHLANWDGVRLIPLPAGADEAATPDGLSPAARADLLAVALSDDPADLLVLGGSLPRSPWGDLLIAGPTLAYIADHPWIQALDEADLFAWPTLPGAPRCPNLLCLPSPQSSKPVLNDLRAALETAPANPLTDLAWQTYLTLTDPTADEQLTDLRAAYLGDAAYLLRAARWANAPGDLADCSADLDNDGSPECLLASRQQNGHLFLILSPRGGRLVFAAANTRQGWMQLVGPRSQFAVGLGEPREWQPGQNLASDPQEIPGGFSDSGDPWHSYQTEIQPGQVSFFLADSGLRKTFQLVPDGLQVTFSSSQPVQTSLPLAIMGAPLGSALARPWLSLARLPGWLERYQASTSPDENQWGWGLAGRAQVWLQADGANLSAVTFSESRDLLHQPEDPDTGYPPGHYLPFPLALVTIDAPGSFTLQLSLK